MESDLEPEILISISFRLPQIAAMDRQDFAEKLHPLIHHSIILGGTTMHFNVQPYDPEE